MYYVLLWEMLTYAGKIRDRTPGVRAVSAILSCELHNLDQQSQDHIPPVASQLKHHPLPLGAQPLAEGCGYRSSRQFVLSV